MLVARAERPCTTPIARPATRQPAPAATGFRRWLETPRSSVRRQIILGGIGPAKGQAKPTTWPWKSHLPGII